jgi:hypothetical protein
MKCTGGLGGEMKFFVKRDKSKALCENCGLVSTTFDYRDVPFEVGQAVACGILVAECEVGHEAVAIPAQSGLAIRERAAQL